MDFFVEDVTKIASKISYAVRELGVDALDPKNWLLRFGCTS